MATSSGLFLATIYNQSQLAERKHVARYWSINTAATAVPLSAHPSPLVITTKLAAAILVGRLFGGAVLPAQYCPCGCDDEAYLFLLVIASVSRRVLPLGQIPLGPVPRNFLVAWLTSSYALDMMRHCIL